MKKELVFDMVLNLFITLTISILGFIVTKAFINNMGINNLGLMKLFSQIVAYLTLLDMGLSSAAAYYFYEPLNKKDWHRVSEIFTTITKFYRRISILIIVVGFIFSPSIIYISGEKTKIIYVYWLLYIINSSLGYALLKYTTLFLADQKYRIVKLIDGIASCFEKIIQLYIIIFLKSFTLFIIVGSIFFIIKLYFYKKFFNTNYPEIKEIAKKDIEILKTAKKILFHKMAYMIVYNTDYIIISKFISLSAVGIYSGYLTIYNLVMTIVGIVHNVLDSKLGKIISKNSNEENFKIWGIMFRISFILGTFLVLIFYFNVNSFISLWLGKAFTLSSITVFIISLNLFIDIIKWPTELFKYKYGYVKDIHLPILESLINIIFSICLVKKIGINGVLLGTLISNLFIVIIFRGILVFKNCFLISKNIYLKELIINLSLSLISCYISNLFLEKYFKYKIFSWTHWLVSVLITCIFLSIIVLFIFMIRNKNRNDVFIIFRMK